MCSSATPCAHSPLVEFHRQVHDRHRRLLLQPLGDVFPSDVAGLVADHVEPFDCMQVPFYRYQLFLACRQLRVVLEPLLADAAMLRREMQRVSKVTVRWHLAHKLEEVERLPRFVCQEGSEWHVAFCEGHAEVFQALNKAVRHQGFYPEHSSSLVCSDYANAGAATRASAQAQMGRIFGHIESELATLSLAVLRATDER